MQRIAEAVEGKLGQVRRRADAALGLMVVITDFARLAARFKKQAVPLVEASRGKVLGSHEGLAGVMLVDHALHKERGPFVGGLFLVGGEGTHLDGLRAALALR